MTDTTTPLAPLRPAALARALAALDHETSPATCPAWDQLDASGIDRYGAAARRLLELLGGETADERAADLVRSMADEHPTNAAWVQDCHHIADRLDEHARRLADEAQQPESAP